MKQRNFFAVLWLACSLSLSAQTQQGYVKTLGRPNQQGRALSGVSIRVKGGHNAVLSGQDGKFEMPMHGKKVGDAFSLQQVQKSGYDLKDKGVVGRQYAYSDKVPLTLVMLSRSDYQQDKQQIENHIYSAVEKRYKSDLSRLEQQLSSHQIATEQYRQQLQQLQDGFGKIQELVEGLADHYALVDYDELDEREREITLAIERGDLEQADQLLQQMNIQQRAQDIADRLKKGQALREEAQQDLVEVLKRQEKDAEYLYQLYTIALARFDNEKARFYIETRAELDSTNVEWQIEAGQFLSEYLADYDKALQLSNRGLRQARLRFGEMSEQTALSYFKIGGIFEEQKNYPLTLEYFQKALDIRQQLEPQEPLLIANCYVALGGVFAMQGDYSQGMEYIDKAFEIRKELLNPIHDDIAEIYYNFAFIQTQFGEYAEAVKNYQLAADILILLHGENYIHVADAYHNMASMYLTMGDLEHAETYTQKAYEIRKRLFGDKHPTVAESLDAWGKLYLQKAIFDESLRYYQQALAIRQDVFGDTSPLVATSYVNVGTVCANKGDFAKGLEFFQSALDINRKVLNASHPNLGANYLNMAICYYSQGHHEKARETLKQAMAVYESMKGGGFDELALCWHLTGEAYNAEGNLEEAAQAYLCAEGIYESLYGKHHAKTAAENLNAGFMYYKMEDYPTAIAFFILSLDAYTKAEGNHDEEIQQTAALLELSYQKHLEKHPDDQKMRKDYQNFQKAMK